MATVTHGIAVGLRGAVGGLIFRNYNGKTVVPERPVYKNESNTEGRRKLRGNFREASYFASNAMEDKRLKAYYQQKAKQLRLPNAYTAALTDYLRKAKVKVTVPSSFTGKKGDLMVIKLQKKSFPITKAQLMLMSKEGEVLREKAIASENGMFLLKLDEDYHALESLKLVVEEAFVPRNYVIQAADFVVVSDWLYT